MNPFEPNPEALALHKKWALSKEVYKLLNAQEPVEDPEPPPPKQVRFYPKAKVKGVPLRRRVLELLTDQPMTASQMARLLVVSRAEALNALSALCYERFAKNLSSPGSMGMYVKIKMKEGS